MHLLLRGLIFRVIFTGIGFLISLLIAKLAGANQFGALSLMIVNAALIHIITGLGTDAAIVWHGIAGENYNRDKIFSFTIITTGIQLLFFYIIAILGFLFLGHSLLGGSFELGIFFAELVYFTGLVLMDKFVSLYYSQQQAKLCNKIASIVAAVLFLIVLVTWIVDPGMIAEYPVWLYSFFIFIPAFILVIYFIVKFNPAIQNISQEEMRSFSSFSFIVLTSNVIQFVANRADYWLISIYYDHVEVGIYAQASKFAQLLWIVPGILAGLVTPALKHADQKLTDAQFISVCRVAFYAHLVISIGLIAISLFIYLYFLPEVYFGGFVSLLLMIPGYLFFITAIILAAWFSAHRLLKVNLIASVICCALMILLDILLIPTLSYNGAAIANLLTYAITTVYFIYQATRLINVTTKDFFAIRKSDFKLFTGRVLIEGRQDT